MVFLNWILIFGVGTATIPVIIHLFNRSRFNVQPWGAMHLLEPVLRVNRKRIKIEQLILLIIRAMIPAMLALCMAAPVLTGCENLAGNSKSSLIVLLDNSYSMAAGGANANFDEAKLQALQAIRHLRNGSDVSVVMMSDAKAMLDEPTFKRALITDRISSMTAGYGKADVNGSFQVGSSTITEMRYPKRDMIVISDFQAISWEDNQSQIVQRVNEWVGVGELKPSLTFFHVGKEITDNVAIMDVKFSKLVVGVGQKVRVDVDLYNFGEKSYPGMRVEMQVGDGKKQVQEKTLGPNASVQARFYHTFKEPGSHLVKFKADGDGTLKADNEYKISVQVLDQIPALLVDGDPKRQALESETAFLEVALQPYEESDVDELSDLVQAKVVTTNQLNATALEGMKLVVLANVSRLTDQQFRTLQGFVKGGGGLLVFPGNKIDADWYNRVMYNSGTGMLPLQFSKLLSLYAGSANRNANGNGNQVEGQKQQHASMVAQTYKHPALTMFNDRANGKLTTSEIWTWYQMKDAAAGGGVNVGSGQVDILARLNTGDPLFAEKKYGQGRVIVCATAADGDWSNMPVRPWYLPLMQQLSSYVASSVEPPRNVQVGQPLIAYLDKSRAGKGGKSATMTDPSNKTTSVTLVDQGTRAVATFKETSQLGEYTLSVPGEKPIYFVVSGPRDESNLTQLSAEEIDELAGRMGGQVARSWKEYEALDKTRRHGHEMWHWIFWALLALFFLEMFLQQWFSRRV